MLDKKYRLVVGGVDMGEVTGESELFGHKVTSAPTFEYTEKYLPSEVKSSGTIEMDVIENNANKFISDWTELMSNPPVSEHIPALFLTLHDRSTTILFNASTKHLDMIKRYISAGSRLPRGKHFDAYRNAVKLQETNITNIEFTGDNLCQTTTVPLTLKVGFNMKSSTDKQSQPK